MQMNGEWKASQPTGMITGELDFFNDNLADSVSIADTNSTIDTNSLSGGDSLEDVSDTLSVISGVSGQSSLAMHSRRPSESSMGMSDDPQAGPHRALHTLSSIASMHPEFTQLARLITSASSVTARLKAAAAMPDGPIELAPSRLRHVGPPRVRSSVANSNEAGVGVVGMTGMVGAGVALPPSAGVGNGGVQMGMGMSNDVKMLSEAEVQDGSRSRKNTREKQRRQEIQQKFDVLQDMLGLESTIGNNGKTQKPDKAEILHATISHINELQEDNKALTDEKVQLTSEIFSLASQLPSDLPAPGGVQQKISLFESMTSIPENGKLTLPSGFL